ncbi:MAG: hypothetical protein LUH02_02125 [Erysipelotrichaceae bacterium]|nr:hypothetical protein [Erysipelotrichaceae bacterium]
MTAIQNTLADELDKGTLFDEQCKHILADPQMLAYIVKNSVKECKDISMDDLIAYFKKHPAQTGIEDTLISGAKIIYDIIVRIDGSLFGGQNNLGLIISIYRKRKAILDIL